MGLKLTKDPSGEYRRTWYAIVYECGKQTSHKLKTPLRGKIPLDASGKFSLALKGDAAFEKSRDAAMQELQAILGKAKEMKAEERNEPGYAEREAFRKLTGKRFEIVRIADLAKRNEERERYSLTGDKQADRYNQSVYDILEHFSKWCAAFSVDKPKTEKVVKLTNITNEVVTAYYADLSNGNPDVLIPVQTKAGIVKKPVEPFSWQSFRKYAFILASVFRYFMPKGAENPFERVYEDGYKGKKAEAKIDKTSVVHETPSAEQIRMIWDYARKQEAKPYLLRLAVIAATTGMRIGDCCLLTWDKVDLLNYRLTTKTRKTGKDICVPIFDYDPSAPDYHETLGELRRELEAALVEKKDGETYVIPQAAAVYRRDPSRINKEGKAVFARALFSTPEPEDAVLVGDKPKSPAQILKLIREANVKQAKKDRLLRTYELHAKGKSYAQIAAAIGNGKGNVSEDLACVEEIAGQKIRVGNPYMGANAKPGLRVLLKKTRRERGQGQRAACLYGWHSLRVYFVVTAINAGIKPDDLRLIVGHSTVRMVLHYYNPEEATAAENMRKQIERKRRQPLALPPPRPAALPAPKESPAVRLQRLDDLLGQGLITHKERERERARILSEL